MARSWEENGSVIVSWSRRSPDSSIVIVGKQSNGHIDVINAFRGQAAEDIYKKLTEKRKKDDGVD